MFKIGDVVVSLVSKWDVNKKTTLLKGNIYTITGFTFNGSYILVDGSNDLYPPYNFILLTAYRRNKILKIKKRINEKI